MGTVIVIGILGLGLWLFIEIIFNNGDSFHCTGKAPSRVRKNWTCCSCKRVIHSGEIAYHSGANRREFGRVYMCSDSKNMK